MNTEFKSFIESHLDSYVSSYEKIEADDSDCYKMALFLLKCMKDYTLGLFDLYEVSHEACNNNYSRESL